MTLPESITAGVTTGHVEHHEEIHAYINDPPAGGRDLLTSTKSSPDTPDDEFPGTSLDAKWTVVSGSAGTVDLLNADANRNIYQVANGKMYVQCGASDSVYLRQDYTLPDGASIVLAFDVPYFGNAGDNSVCRMTLNDNDASPTSGSIIWGGMEQDSGEWVPQGTSSTSHELVTHNIISELVYTRIVRSGLTYRSYASYGLGRSWSFAGSMTAGAELTNIWIEVTKSTLASGETNPVVTVFWIRQGTSGVDPW